MQSITSLYRGVAFGVECERRPGITGEDRRVSGAERVRNLSLAELGR